MSREILFRGKCFNTGEWVEGFLGIEVPDEFVIQQFSFDEYFKSECIDQYAVKPETVGQYTGLTDKNGTKIFEGDIVRLQNLKLLYEIYWDKKEARYKARNGGCVSPLCNDYNVFVEEAVGNVFDNPELLEGEK